MAVDEKASESANIFTRQHIGIPARQQRIGHDRGVAVFNQELPNFCFQRRVDHDLILNDFQVFEEKTAQISCANATTVASLWSGSMSVNSRKLFLRRYCRYADQT